MDGIRDSPILRKRPTGEIHCPRYEVWRLIRDWLVAFRSSDGLVAFNGRDRIMVFSSRDKLESRPPRSICYDGDDLGVYDGDRRKSIEDLELFSFHLGNILQVLTSTQ
jgi:hypothetical protein